jgi:hypothetical protein
MRRAVTFGASLLLLLILSTPLKGQIQNKIYDNINTGACGFTDTATLDLQASAHLDQIALWFNWARGESSLPYTISTGGRVVRSAAMTRGQCDAYQNSWCLAVDRLNMDLGPGSYTVRAGQPRVCQNAGSGGRGFIQAYGSYLSSRPQPNPPPQPTPQPQPNPNDPCAGKPRTSSPFDPCNNVTPAGPVSTNRPGTVPLVPSSGATASGTTPGGRSIEYTGTATRDAKGNITACVLAHDTNFTNYYGNTGASAGWSTDRPQCKGGFPVSFDARGNVMSCTLSTNVGVTNSYGNTGAGSGWSRSFQCRANAPILFDARGNVTSCTLPVNYGASNSYGAPPSTWSASFECLANAPINLDSAGNIIMCTSAQNQSIGSVSCRRNSVISMAANGTASCVP